MKLDDLDQSLAHTLGGQTPLPVLVRSGSRPADDGKRLRGTRSVRTVVVWLNIIISMTARGTRGFGSRGGEGWGISTSDESLRLKLRNLAFSERERLKPNVN